VLEADAVVVTLPLGVLKVSCCSGHAPNRVLLVEFACRCARICVRERHAY